VKVVDQVTWDWDDALGDTIREKYEGLYVFLINQQKKLTPDNGMVALTANDIIMSIFDMSWRYHSPIPFYVNGILKYMGNLRWELWQDSTLPMDEIWLYNDTEGIKVTVANMII
jgi:hypothetical protein